MGLAIKWAEPEPGTHVRLCQNSLPVGLRQRCSLHGVLETDQVTLTPLNVTADAAWVVVEVALRHFIFDHTEITFFCSSDDIGSCVCVGQVEAAHV